MDQKIVGFNQFGAVIRKVKAWVESTFLTLSKDSADQSIAGVRSVSDIINLAKETSQLTKITYAELKALRDRAKLVPGMQYRITDYTCTTIAQDTQSAGHVFDIIVTADDELTLNAKARAIHHEGDTYFTKSDLAKWQIWYDLNNDKTKYGWSDEANGKGVIYRMIDEYGNDCPYDFKNIQFKRWKITSTHNSLNDEYIGIDGLDNDDSTIPDKNDFKWLYTFSFMKKASSTLAIESIYDSFTDSHISSTNIELAGDNIIKPYVTGGVMQLNYALFFSEATDDSVSFPYMNKIGSNCSYNTLKGNCMNNTFENNCMSNILLNTCKNNIFGDNCTNNTFGNSCNNNTFGDSCNNNTFGDYCSGNDLGDSCNNNTFGYSCTNNAFGNICTNNKFGNICNNNAFGNNCQNNSFGNNYQNNSFGDNCQKITSGEIGTPIDYIRYVDIASGVSYIKFKSTTSTSKSNYLQNITLHKGVKGTNDTPLVINVDVLNQDYEITYAKAADGTLVKQIAQA